MSPQHGSRLDSVKTSTCASLIRGKLRLTSSATIFARSANRAICTHTRPVWHYALTRFRFESDAGHHRVRSVKDRTRRGKREDSNREARRKIEIHSKLKSLKIDVKIGEEQKWNRNAIIRIGRDIEQKVRRKDKVKHRTKKRKKLAEKWLKKVQLRKWDSITNKSWSKDEGK